jgi:maltooligosyltrehalose trehalohydrolase
LRTAMIIPRLDGTRALTASAVGPKAVVARWRMGDGAVLTVASNLDPAAVPIDQPAGELLFASAPPPVGWLPGHSTSAHLDRPPTGQ